MDKNSLNTNKQFMIGNGMLAFGVFAVIIIFLYMSFRFQRKADKVQTYEGVYNIELTNSFAGDSIAVYLNDSLLLDQTMPDANLKVEIKRFAEDNVLMVVDNKTDKTTPFNLNPDQYYCQPRNRSRKENGKQTGSHNNLCIFYHTGSPILIRKLSTHQVSYSHAKTCQHHNESHTVFTETCHVRHQRSDIAIPTKDASVSEHGRNYQQPWSQILQKTELPFQTCIWQSRQ